MSEIITTAVRNHLTVGESYLLAVSGGVDSRVLLDVCHSLIPELKLRLAIAHINHNLRPESGEDAEFVQKLAVAYNLPIYLKELEGQRIISNIESWARTERYKFLQQICSEQSFTAILTAHTASDCVETLLMRLLANKEPRSILRFDAKRRVLRPLLDLFRAEILEYCNSRQLQFKEDSSNSDERYLRNRIRSQLLPVIEERFGLESIKALHNRSIALAEDQLVLDDLAAELAKLINLHEPGSREWLRALTTELKSQPEGLRWRVARECLNLKLGFIMGRKNSTSFVRFILSDSEGVQVGGGWEIRRKAGGLIFSRSAPAN